METREREEEDKRMEVEGVKGEAVRRVMAVRRKSEGRR